MSKNYLFLMTFNYPCNFIAPVLILYNKTFGRSDTGYISLNQSDQRETNLVGRKGVPIVYDHTTNPKTFSLQKKKAESYSFQTSKQNHNRNTKYQANLYHRLFAATGLFTCTSTRYSLLVLLPAT